MGEWREVGGGVEGGRWGSGGSRGGRGMEFTVDEGSGDGSEEENGGEWGEGVNRGVEGR